MRTTDSSSVDSRLLSQIKDGMDVYDTERNRVGSVDAIFFGAAGDEEIAKTTPATAPRARDTTNDTIIQPFAEVFDPRDEIPEELAERLRYHGYVRIDAGWFGADRYFMPEQIASVNSEGVFLNTHKDKLIKE